MCPFVLYGSIFNIKIHCGVHLFINFNDPAGLQIVLFAVFATPCNTAATVLSFCLRLVDHLNCICAAFHFPRVLPLSSFRRKRGQTVSKPRHELGIPPGPPQWGQQVLYSLWPSLAFYCVPLQGHGVCGGCREGLG